MNAKRDPRITLVAGPPCTGKTTYVQRNMRVGDIMVEALYAAVRTDPAVQDAMLAALAEGGRLVEEEGLWPCPSRHYDRDHNGEWCDEACRSYEGHAGDHECVSGRHWPRTADDLPRKVHWIEPEWREVPQ